jgi:hypothetical protein
LHGHNSRQKARCSFSTRLADAETETYQDFRQPNLAENIVSTIGLQRSFIEYGYAANEKILNNSKQGK